MAILAMGDQSLGGSETGFRQADKMTRDRTHTADKVMRNDKSAENLHTL